MAVSRRLRFEVLKRDGHACRYCGAMTPDVALTVDHVIPVSLGGGDEPSNLVSACVDCNSGKASTHPDDQVVEDVDAAALLFAKAIERAVYERTCARYEVQIVTDSFLERWNDWSYPNGEHPELPSDWRVSVERFYGLGLSLPFMLQLIEQTMRTPKLRYAFRYFCKLAWGEISLIQETARRLIEDGEV